MTSALKNKRGDSEGHRGEGCVKVETEIGVMQAQAKDAWGH